MKEYQIKVYDMLWVYKNTINPLIIRNSINFSMNINGGQWQLSILLNEKITNNNYKFSDIVIVTVFDKNNNWKQIYRWHITRIKRTIDQSWEWIELTCLGSRSFMNRIFFRDWASNLIFNKSQLPSQTIKDVIDLFNTHYNYFTYDKIIDYSNSISINFDYNKSWDAIDRIANATPLWYYYVDSMWDVTYRAKDNILVNHRVKLDYDVDYFSSDEEIETLTNKVTVNKTTWPFLDSASITEYWRIEDNVSSSTDWTSSNTEFGNSYLQANKDKKRETKIIINSRYNIESIEPWHHITLLNADYTTIPLQVMKVSYSYDKVNIELEKYTTFSETILSQ